MNKIIKLYLGDTIKCYNGTTGLVTDIYTVCEVQINYSMRIHTTDIKFINDIQLTDDCSI